MNSRLFLFLLIFPVLCSFKNNNDSTKLKKNHPNIIVILTDDDDYSGIGAYGSEVSTPNIDALAANGVKFANFYNNSRCSPSRASLLTGRYPQKVGVGDLCQPTFETKYSSYLGYLNVSFKIIPQYLKKLGYATFMSGKWHLGGRYNNIKSKRKPYNKGFDGFFGVLGASADYFGKEKCQYQLNDDVCFDSQNYKNFYCTDVFTDFAIDFMDKTRKTDKPFFLYLPYTAPHQPIDAPKKLVKKYRKYYKKASLKNVVQNRVNKLKEENLVDSDWNYKIETQVFKPEINKDRIEKFAIHAAMMEKVDENVGRITDHLKKTGELDNTIIIYLSDNGGDGSSLSSLYKAPFRGTKTSLWEGGIKTHCIFHWPEKIDTTFNVQARCHIIDLLPTLLDIVEIDYPPTEFDGISLVDPLLNGVDSLDRDFLFWDLYGQQAVIHKEWKWVNSKSNKDFLFNLEEDGFETKNIIGGNRKVLRMIKAEFKEHVKRNNITEYKEFQKATKKKP